MKKIITSFSIVGLISGCATTSDIVPYGKDTYMLSAGDIWGGYSSGTLQVKAAQRANEYCQSMGKVFVVRNTGTAGVQGWTSTSSTLVFSCVDEKDAENTRPNLRRN
jgi:hypothetical protein